MQFKFVATSAIVVLCALISKASPVDDTPLVERQCPWGQNCSGGP